MGSVPERFAGDAHVFDVQPLEWYAWAPLLVLILAAGLYPKLVLGVTDGAVQGLVRVLGSG
jgi:NADH-quinone oxidoreductase subunit M